MRFYTVLYVCVYLERAMPNYAQRKSWLAEHGIEGVEALLWMGSFFPTRDKVVLATPEPADTHRAWLG